MRGHDIEIDLAHRVYDGGRGSDRPRTLIFRVLRWHDRSEILRGARQAYPVKCAQDNVTLLFFPDFSPATAIRRKAFGPVLKKMTALGLQPFLIYPAVIKLRHKGEQKSFDSPQKAEDFISFLSQRKTYAAALRGGVTGEQQPLSLRPSGRGLMAGIEEMPAARKKMVAGGIWMLARSLFFLSSFLSPPGIVFIFIRCNCLFAGKTNPPFFFLYFSGGD